MARAPNPYHVHSGPYEGIGQGISNLGEIFLSQQDPVRQAQAEQAAWAARQSREGVTDMTMARDGRLRGQEQIENFDPAGDNRALVGGLFGSGAADVSDIGRLFHMVNANFGGTDEQVGRSHVGMGNTIGTGDGFSLPDREGIAQRDQDFALESQRAQDAGAMARLLQTQRFTAGQNALDRTTDAAGAEDPLAGIDWLDETRRSSIEDDMGGMIAALASSSGLEVTDLPPALTESVLARGMQLLRDNRLAPREAVLAAWQEHGVEVDPGSSGVFGIGRRDPTVNFQRPGRSAPAAGGGPVPGQTRYTDPDDGTTYLFRGGDPNDPNSWETVQ